MHVRRALLGPRLPWPHFLALCRYSFLMSNNMSFFETHPSSDRVSSYIFHNYTSLFSEHWRKGSQWFTFTREFARKIYDNSFYYDVWERGRSEFQFENHRHKYNPCVADEHFMQTLASIFDMESKVFPDTLTFAVMGDKNKAVRYTVSGTPFKQMHPAHWHPILLSDFSPRAMDHYRTACSYDLSRTAAKQNLEYSPSKNTRSHSFNAREQAKGCRGQVRCVIDSPCAPCFLFARKVQGAVDVKNFTAAFKQLPA